jgi:hypothetical protein
MQESPAICGIASGNTRTNSYPDSPAVTNLTMLVYYEAFYYPDAAIFREKEIKGWRREKKIKLVNSMNPQWDDLAKDWQDLYKPQATEVGDPSLRLKSACAQDDAIQRDCAD